jgi:NADPH:quinone reductase-like Zn-dependent oxidoreductase
MRHGADQRVLLHDLLTMVGDDRISPVHPTTYPLDQVATALDHLLARQVVGKIALVP